MQTPMKLDDIDREIIRLMAELNMQTRRVAQAMNYHDNSIRYRCEQIHRRTGLTPRCFYDLVELLDTIGGWNEKNRE